MVTLSNGIIKAEIIEKGAEIRRLTVNGEDRFWSGDPEIWGGVAPVLFPNCGGMKDDKYTLNGKEYNIIKHGFAKNMVFEVESQSSNSAVFLLKDTEETMKSYPWHFEFRIKYTLVAASVKVEYDIKNTSDTPMYAAVGGHEAYSCPEGVEDYDIIFEKKETLRSIQVENGILTRNTETVLFESDTLPLYNKYFEIDALVLTDLKSRFVTLRNRKNGKSVSVSFGDFDYLLIWTIPEAPYVCIEPWTAPPSYEDEGYDITKKEGTTKIAPSESFKTKHIIYF